VISDVNNLAIIN